MQVYFSNPPISMARLQISMIVAGFAIWIVDSFVFYNYLEQFLANISKLAISMVDNSLVTKRLS